MKEEVGMSLACSTGLACGNSQNELNPFEGVKVNQNLYSILWNFPKSYVWSLKKGKWLVSLQELLGD